MKNIILYVRRNTGLLALMFFSRYFDNHLDNCQVITDDEDILYWCNRWKMEVITIDEIGEYDWLFCVHGNKIIPEEKLKEGRCFNFHPCLFKYKGHDPISRYIKNGDMEASVGCHIMTKDVDEGEVVHEEFFTTPVCNTHQDFYNIALQKYLICFDTVKSKLFPFP